MVVGCAIGLAAGYWGGALDGVLMRLIDAVLSFPALVLALALGAVLGAGLGGVLLALGVVYTPTFARLMRGQVLAITARDYVDAPGLVGQHDQRRPRLSPAGAVDRVRAGRRALRHRRRPELRRRRRARRPRP